MMYDDEEERVSLVPITAPAAEKATGYDPCNDPTSSKFILKTDSDEDSDTEEHLMMRGSVDTALVKF